MSAVPAYPCHVICPSCRAENDASAEVCFTCRSVLSAITQGHVIAGRYEIVSFLGRGGMGAVYRAHDRLLEETVAIKILRADVAGTPELARRFRTEIKLARRISHPNVCRIHEYGEEGSLRFISMELVEGRSLREALDRDGPLSAERACQLGVQMAAGLEAIHAAGVIHRDLKPPNIMIDSRDCVRLMDFGIAKSADGANPTTDYVVGSPEYMSPEQGRGRQVDARSDIYSLGIVLFELVTGSPPFRGDTPVATLMMHVEQPPPLDGPAASRIPEPMRELLRRALAKEPRNRFASAHEMGQVLRKLSGAPAGTPSRATPREHAKDWRGPLLVGLAGVVVAVIVVRRPGAPARDASPPPSRMVSAPITIASTQTPAAPPSQRDIPAPVRRPPETARVVPALETPSPTPAPTPTTTPTPVVVDSPQRAAETPSPPTPSASAAPLAETGMLAIVVSPWADVEVDGASVGQTPLRPLALATGIHSVLLSHPDFQPYPRRVTIRAGETFRLHVDLASDGVRKRPR